MPGLRNTAAAGRDAGLLGDLLKEVSRSFYLSLRVLPAPLRRPIGLAYLLARAADTIADTAALASERRLEGLQALREAVNGAPARERLHRIATMALQRAAALGHPVNPAEQRLLQSLAPAVAALADLDETDRQAVRSVVGTLIDGMVFDLKTFPDENCGLVRALPTRAVLDRYTYLIAGCVGEFWTALSYAHMPALRHWDVPAMAATGVRLGKALQLTNIVRDCASDLRIGRCYVPREILGPTGLDPEDLLRPENSARAWPALQALMNQALAHYEAAVAYVLAIPPGCRRLRLACLWPILIGLRTLQAHARHPAWLDPDNPTRIARRTVYALMLRSALVAGSDRRLNDWLAREIAAVRSAMVENAPAPRNP
jgi:farnesyl-diphosphate farnesyltransferase